MASLLYRLTYSALTASLLMAPAVSGAQETVTTQPGAGTPAPTPATSATPAPTPRPLDDDRLPSAPASSPAVSSAPPASTTPTTGSQPAPLNSTPLPPVSTPAPAPTEPAPAAPEPAPTQTQAPRPKARPTRHAAPRPTTEVKLSVAGKVVDDPDATRAIKVGDGDTVNIIAERLHVSKEAVIKANHLKKPYALDVGQMLKIPTPKDYVIQTGDTLMGVSRRFGVSPAVLGEVNGFDIRNRLHVGQKIALPSEAEDAGPIKTVVPGPPGRSVAEEEPAPQAPAPRAEPPPRAVERAPEPDATAPEPSPTAAPVASAVEPSHPVPYQQAPPVRPSATETEPSAPARAAEPSAPEAQVRLSVQGRVIDDRQKSREMRVGAGDTVNVIADRLLTPREDLIKLNRLKKPYELDRGEILKIPTPKAYVAERGDTLAEIGRRFGLSASALAEINDLDENPRLREGQKIALPTDVHDNGPIRTVVAPQRPSYRYSVGEGEGRALPPSRYSTPPAYSGPPVIDNTPAPTDAAISAAGRGRFIWPLAGQLLSGYGPKPGGQRNDGMDLAAPLGAPVMAAGEGDVVYAGNLAEFGNLVLIRDDDGWVTAYAHLARTEVKIKDHVRRGDEIGQVGQTGGAPQPELHFEIRYAPSPKDKARPIDPTLVLPSR